MSSKSAWPTTAKEPLAKVNLAADTSAACRGAHFQWLKSYLRRIDRASVRNVPLPKGNFFLLGPVNTLYAAVWREGDKWNIQIYHSQTIEDSQFATGFSMVEAHRSPRHDGHGATEHSLVDPATQQLLDVSGQSSSPQASFNHLVRQVFDQFHLDPDNHQDRVYMATKCGVSDQALSNWVSRPVGAHAATLNKFCLRLNLTRRQSDALHQAAANTRQDQQQHARKQRRRRRR